MKSVFLSSKNSQRLTIAAIKPAKVGANAVRLKIHASSLNPHDWQVFDGFKPIYKLPLPLPNLRLGHDLSGTIIEVGRSVKDLKVGDSLFGMSPKTGAFADEIVIKPKYLALKPENLDHQQAASVPMVALTALQALRRAKIQPGKRVLIIGGSGGVGSAAVQIAKLLGAHVTAVCSGKNVEWVKERGADNVIDYTKESFTNSAEAFDIIFDTIGDETWNSCKAVLKPKSHFITTNTGFVFILKTLFNMSVGRFMAAPKAETTMLALPLKDDMAQIKHWLEQGDLTTHIAHCFELDDISTAFETSKLGRTRGKIVIQHD